MTSEEYAREKAKWNSVIGRFVIAMSETDLVADICLTEILGEPASNRWRGSTTSKKLKRLIARIPSSTPNSTRLIELLKKAKYWGGARNYAAHRHFAIHDEPALLGKKSCLVLLTEDNLPMPLELIEDTANRMTAVTDELFQLVATIRRAKLSDDPDQALPDVTLVLPIFKIPKTL